LSIAYDIIYISYEFVHDIAATALSNTMECPTCKCPKDELERTDKLYPVRSSAQVGAGVEKARAELLNRHGSIKDRCIGKVYYIIQDIIYNIIHDTYNFIYDFIYDVIVYHI
jgi:hypothetical protein